MQGMLLSNQDRKVLLRRYFDTKDPALKEELVLTYQPLVEYVARKLSYQRRDLDDLIQVGMMGLLRALDHFDFAMQTDFSTFATPNIVGEIRHYFRDKHNVVRVPRKMQEMHSKIKTYIKERELDGFSPTISDIAQALEVSQEVVLEAMEASRATSVISLDLPTYSDADSRSGSQSSETLMDTLGDDAQEDAVLEYASIRDLVQTLPEREQEIIRLRFYQGYSQREIADIMGLSQMHVSRLLNQLLKKLKKQIPH